MLREVGAGGTVWVRSLGTYSIVTGRKKSTLGRVSTAFVGPLNNKVISHTVKLGSDCFSCMSGMKTGKLLLVCKVKRITLAYEAGERGGMRGEEGAEGGHRVERRRDSNERDPARH